VPRVSTRTLVRALHQSPARLVVAVAGGGSRAIGTLLESPGASRTVLEAVVPYAPAALVALLGGQPAQFASESTARALAMACFHRGLGYGTAAGLVGVGGTASLRSDRPKRGPHRVHVATQTAGATEVWSCELVRGARDRLGEERFCAALILNAVAHASGLEQRVRIRRFGGERILKRANVAPQAWSDLLLGRRETVSVGPPRPPGAWPPRVVFPGAFNPPHAGHRAMARVAEERLGGPPVWELSITNVDKPPLDFLEIEQRLAGLGGVSVVLTRAARFVDKAALFPGATFVVGADTIGRIADPSYYGGRAGEAAAAIARLGEAGCRFLVFGRWLRDRFQILADLDLPAALGGLCEEVPAGAFRADTSSTEIRRGRRGTKADQTFLNPANSPKS